MLKQIFVPILAFFMLSACNAQKTTSTNGTSEVQKISDYIAGKDYAQYQVATFAGGCFWCTEASFERINGVVDVISGYSGGEKAFPTYYQVASGKTKHAEAIQIYYDPSVISYDKLLEVFFVAHDPTTLNRQGPDVGPQYRSAIFYRNSAELAAAEKAIEAVNKSKAYSGKVVTQLNEYVEFWTAEKYHQDYYEIDANQRNPYIARVSKPKVEKVMKTFKADLKDKYKK